MDMRLLRDNNGDRPIDLVLDSNALAQLLSPDTPLAEGLAHAEAELELVGRLCCTSAAPFPPPHTHAPTHTMKLIMRTWWT